MHKKISASLMCISFTKIESSIRELEEAKCDYLHFDIMDGSFVPNFTLGPDFVKAIREITDIPFDIHFMVQQPERHLVLFDFQKDDYVSIHMESTIHLQRTLAEIKSIGAHAMVALNPSTPLGSLDYVLDDISAVLIMTVNPGFAGQKIIPSTIKKVADTRQYLNQRGYQHIEIEVDGNVSCENARKLSDSGADIFVAGTSSLFVKEKSIKEATKHLRESIVVPNFLKPSNEVSLIK